MFRYLYLFILITLCFMSTAFAQLILEEGKIKLIATSSEAVNKTIHLHNQTSEPLKVKAYIEDFNYVPPYSDGAKKFITAGTLPNSIFNWTKISPQEFELAPQSSAEVNVTITPPADTQGGYYGVIFFETSAANEEQGTNYVKLVTRVGSLVFFESPNKKKGAVVQEITNSKLQFKGTLKNTGDVILLPTGSYYILDAEGIPVDRGVTSKLYLPGGEIGNFEFESKAELKPGQYTLGLSIDLEDGDETSYETEFTIAASGEAKIITPELTN